MILCNIDKIISILKKEKSGWKTPAVSAVAELSRDPFHVLISCVLSLRTKDEVTALASQKLLFVADTPQKMIKLKKGDIERLIYPAGFYKTKAENILNICHTLISKYGSAVPDNIDDLLTLKGVGRKTANLVVTLGYNKYGICVDTHVHRISNRLGYVATNTPDETETALRKKLPKKYWKIYNDLLVTLGQNICRPVSPFCSICPVNKYCNKVGVDRHR